VVRKATSRGQRGQSRPGFPLGRSIPQPLKHDPEKWNPIFRKGHAPAA
jgi:hypothetical protein